MSGPPPTVRVVSESSLRVGSVAWRDARRGARITVVAKATFSLRPGESPLAPVQDPVSEADEYWDPGEPRSLRVATDLAPAKPEADVLVVGHAYAPRGRPAVALVARLAVASIDKRVEVFSDRVVPPRGTVHQGASFEKMPLRWERAAGGLETNNPVGVPSPTSADRGGLVVLPNLMAPGAGITSDPWSLAPMSFGPIAPDWPSRRARLPAGLSAADASGGGALPEGFDFGFFNVAPKDQRLAQLRGDEPLLLENLHPDHARLETRLVFLPPRAMVERAGAREAFAMRCDTLIVDTDRGVCSLVWRVAIPLDRAERGRIAVGPSLEEDLPTVVGAPARADETLELRSSIELGAQVLPFIGSMSSPMEGEDDEAVATIRGGPGAMLPTSDTPAPVEPPPLIGPLATAEMLGARDVAPLARLTPPAPLAVEPSTSTSEPHTIADPFDAYPIERCARIAASLACGGVDEEAVLARHEISAADWKHVSRHWQGELRLEASRGRATLLARYDEAFVGQLEAERGRIDVEGYASLLVAVERGRGREEMIARGLPPGALLRIERVWMRRTEANDALAKAVRVALQHARTA